MPEFRSAIVAVGAYLPCSGFTRVLETLFAELSDDYVIHWVGVGNKSAMKTVDGYHLYPCNLKGGDVFGARQALSLADETDAQAIILLNDLWMLSAYVDSLLVKAKRPVIAYCPLDGHIFDDKHCYRLRGLHTLVTYTEFAENEFRRSYQRLTDKHGDFNPPALAVIGHGVDVDRFYPLSETERRQWRAHFFPELPADTPVILNANRPTPRKGLDLTLRAYARLRQQFSEPIHLCLHQATASDEEFGVINHCMDELGLSTSDVSVSRAKLTDEALNGLYNACDVGLNTAAGEGWGLISFEHAATCRAQVVPAHSACAEIWRDAAICVPAEQPIRPMYTELELRVPDQQAVVEGLVALLTDTDKRHRVAKACWQRALSKQWRWSALADQWRDLLGRF